MAQQKDPFLDWLEGMSEYAPAAGSIAGTIGGGVLGGTLGALGGPAGIVGGAAAGAGIGGGLGASAGGAAKLWGDDREATREEELAAAKERDDKAEIDRLLAEQKTQAEADAKAQAKLDREAAMNQLLSRFL